MAQKLGPKALILPALDDGASQGIDGVGGVTIGELHTVTLWAWGTEDALLLGAYLQVTFGGLSFDVQLTTVNTPYVLSGTPTTDADFTLTRKGATAHGKLFVDAVHLVNIDGVDDTYLLGGTGHVTAGYIGTDGAASFIPLIVDRVGPYFCDSAWVYNYDASSWSYWRIPMTGFGYDSILAIQTIGSLQGTIAEQNFRFDEKRITEFAPTNLIGGVDGEVYEIAMNSRYDYENVLDRPILYFWESKDFDLDAPYIDKTLSRIVLYHNVGHPENTLLVAVSTDSGQTYTDEQEVPIRTEASFTIVDFFVTGNQVRFRVKAETPGFYLSGFGVKIIPRGESHVY